MARFEIYAGKEQGNQVILAKFGEAETRKEAVEVRRKAKMNGSSTVLLYTDGKLDKVGIDV